MDMIVDFPGGDRVDAQYGSFTIMTDQRPSDGGEGSAPTPFTLFLASLATCAGIYVLGFCKKRKLPTDGIRLIQRVQRNPENRMVKKVELEIQVPSDFPEKYHSSLVRSAELCAVKKHLQKPPAFEIHTQVVE